MEVAVGEEGGETIANAVALAPPQNRESDASDSERRELPPFPLNLHVREGIRAQGKSDPATASLNFIVPQKNIAIIPLREFYHIQPLSDKIPKRVSQNPICMFCAKYPPIPSVFSNRHDKFPRRRRLSTFRAAASGALQGLARILLSVFRIEACFLLFGLSARIGHLSPQNLQISPFQVSTKCQFCVNSH